VRSVALKTRDKSVARTRAKDYVEQRIREIALERDPGLRTKHNKITTVLKEYIDDLVAVGNTDKQANLVDGRIKRVIKKSRITEFTQIDALIITKAVSDLQHETNFATATANRYLEAMRASTRWMFVHERWDRDSLALARKLKGDTSNSRPRAILSLERFEHLLRVTRQQPERRNLTGEQRHWLYLVSSQTGLRAQECHSLTPANFHLDENPPFVEIRNTISKRGEKTGKKDRLTLQPAFVEILRDWLVDKPYDEQLWGTSRSWWYKAAELLRHDLTAAELPLCVRTPEGEAVIDFHSFRGLQVTNAMRTGEPTRVVMKVARLSSEKLLDRYVKISEAEVTACVNAMPVPNLRSSE